MYLSTLLVDAGTDPDRPRPGRDWLRNAYHVHQRLCMGFPSAGLRSTDPEFLKPYDPAGFSHVHGQRSPEQAFLFRVDPQQGGNPVVLVQSALRPDWDYAFHNAGFLLAAKPATREYDPKFTNGQTLRFRLVANPTRKIDTKSGPDGEQRNGRRVPVKYNLLVDWLAHHGGKGGFEIADDSCNCQPGYLHMHKSKETGNQRLFAVRFDGRLRVSDAGMLAGTLTSGIGPGKAFGFGLLTVAPDGP